MPPPAPPAPRPPPRPPPTTRPMFSIPWPGLNAPVKYALVTEEHWPHRLLNVNTMNSFIREWHDTYNTKCSPKYNVLGYTWGSYMDPTGKAAQLSVRGIDWPIPRVLSSHFTPATFHQAIERAARGYKHCCEWVWVDIACIPQWCEHETETTKALRDQDIGRQVQIFKRAYFKRIPLSTYGQSQVSKWIASPCG